uniref:EGF-like domain-containing protein n=1 Tax=Syphacia muris TaxID=451379 RepID=A0A0N5A939_9BILA
MRPHCSLLTAIGIFCCIPFLVTSQDSPVCSVNQIFNGKTCTCAPGYFSSHDKKSKSRCEDECEEVYSTLFTYGTCVNNIFGRIDVDQRPECDLRCGMRVRTLVSIGTILVFAASIATLVFTLPMCIATCASCLNAKKANRNAKRVFAETQATPSKDTQMQTLSYNPYGYWPYYGRG